MAVKLLKSKWYIISLDTRLVDVRRHYDRFWEAVDKAHKEGLPGRFTAMTGKHILEHTKTWIIPLTVDEALEKYMDEISDGTFTGQEAEGELTWKDHQ